MKINLILADDHQIVIEGLKAVLEAEESIEVCGEAQNGVEVIELIETIERVDVVVLDINMPEMNGIECARKIKQSYPQIKIIILTMYAQKSFIEELLKIGIDGCLLKNNSGKELKEAVLRVNSGKSYYDFIQSFNVGKNSLSEYKLGDREIEIIKLLAEGFTSPQIAEKLFISVHTVRTHRKNILKKTELHTTSDLVQFALNFKLI